MRIIGPPSATRTDVGNRLMGLGTAPLFTGTVFPALWDEAVQYGVDPVGVVAQSAKETSWGRFTGKVVPEACNPCGLKIRVLGMYGPATANDEPLAHAIFPNWQIGARAQVEHLRAYAGWPVDTVPVDPRYTLALKGPGTWCENFEDLSGKWARSPTYGAELVTIARRLQGAI